MNRGARRARAFAPLAAAVALLLSALVLPTASARFSATAPTAAASIAAAPVFQSYPDLVRGDHPTAYYRMEDATGSMTAADSSGNGRTGAYALNISRPQSLYLPFDDGAGAGAADLSGNTPAAGGTAADGSALPATLAGGAGWRAGWSGSALALDGTSAYATTGPALDTSGSFTVFAWVYLTDLTRSAVAVSQRGAQQAAYSLGYDQPSGKWSFTVSSSDTATAPVAADTVTGPAATTGTWTLLMASYAGGTMSLWAGTGRLGAVSASRSHAAPFAASAATDVGAGWRNGARTGFWAGAVDEVRVFNDLRSLTDFNNYVSGVTVGPALQWRFEETSGTTTADVSGAANLGTLVSTTLPRPGGKTGLGAGLTGSSSSYVESARAAVDTSTSFSVAAWVKLGATPPTPATPAAADQVVLSGSGTTSSSFFLSLSSTGLWRFALTSADATNPTVTGAVSATAATTNLTTFTHLVGVHDATAGQVRLYVGGTLAGSAAVAGSWNGPGPVEAGRRRWNGGWDSPLAGVVDDVRVYGRALTPQEAATVAADTTVANPLLGSYSPRQPGALDGAQQGQAGSKAVAFYGRKNGYLPLPLTNPTTFTLEAWFRTNSLFSANRGNVLLNFGGSPTGNSLNTAQIDRRLWVTPRGTVAFGLADGDAATVESAQPASGPGYLDGAWHHVAVTVSPGSGVVVYVDGERVAQRTYTAPASFTGYWRWGGDTLTPLCQPSATCVADFFQGTIDEVAFYPTVLTAQQVARHFYANF